MMSAPTVNSDALLAVLLPELEKLCKNAPQFGSISLRADIHDGDAGRVATAIEISRKIAPRATR
jgi:hypothetical protein